MLVISGFVIVMCNFLFLAYRYFTAMKRVQEYIFTFNPIYMTIGIIFPIVWWLYSTKEDDWNFYNRKNLTLRIVIINGIMILMQWVWTMAFDVFVYRICRLPVGRNLTESMIINLCRAALGLSAGGLGYALYYIIDKALTTNDMGDKVNNFRWQHIVDTRKDKEQKYDLKILRNMQSGATILIKEVDRMVHMVLLGQSGTGKTSSTIIPAIICDLNKKVENMLKRHDELRKLIEKGHAYVKAEPGKAVYTEYDVYPTEGHENEVQSIKKKYQDCGLTMMAPNQSVIKDAIKLCKARGLPINIIDPMPLEDYKNENVKLLRINPFYIKPGLAPKEAQIEIVHKAQVFSDTLMAINELQKSTETYFRDLNTSITSNVAVICMLRAYLKEEQTWMQEVDSCIREFETLRPMIVEIEKILHMQIIVHEMPDKKSDTIRVDTPEKEEPDQNGHKDVVYEDMTDSDVPERFREEGMTAIEYREYTKQIGESYKRIIYSIKKDLLGVGEEKMQDQARGLRVIMEKLLLDPRIDDIFSAKDKNIVDWGRALEKNEITLINTALEIGSSASTGLGLFLMLDMKNAMESRPEDTRTPHFFTIDEATQYMHPVIEDMFAIYRQYGGACTFAFQSFSQLEKSPMTKFLGGVIKGAGTHIVFGRITPEEMAIYEKMVGEENMEVIQNTISMNSELDPNHSVTHSRRTMTENNPAIAGYKMRMQNFQEVTAFSIDQGRVLGGIKAKVSFANKGEYKDKKIHYINFSKYVDLDRRGSEKVKHREAMEHREEESIKVEEFKTGIRHTVDTDKPALEEINSRPIATDEEVRRSMGRMDIFLDSLDDNNWNNFYKRTLEQAEKELENKEQPEDKEQAEENPNEETRPEEDAAQAVDTQEEEVETEPEEESTDGDSADYEEEDEEEDDEEAEKRLAELNSQHGKVAIG